MGNPKVIRSAPTNYDLSVEWYFTRGWPAVRGATSTRTFPTFRRRSRARGTMQDAADTGSVRGVPRRRRLPDQQTVAGRRRTGRRPGIYSISQFQDAPGGEIKGYEFSYQQDLTFLPGYFKNFGVQANFTKLSSELQLHPRSRLHALPPVRPQMHAGRSVPRRIAQVGQLHAVLRHREVERTRVARLS